MQSLTNEIGVYVLCDLDQVPIYVGRSTDGVSDRICGPICGPQAVTFVSVLILLLKSTMDWRRGRDTPHLPPTYLVSKAYNDRSLNLCITWRHRRSIRATAMVALYLEPASSTSRTLPSPRCLAKAWQV